MSGRVRSETLGGSEVVAIGDVGGGDDSAATSTRPRAGVDTNGRAGSPTALANASIWAEADGNLASGELAHARANQASNEGPSVDPRRDGGSSSASRSSLTIWGIERFAK